MKPKTSFYEYMKQKHSCKEPDISSQYAKDLHLYFDDSPFGDLTIDMMRDVDFPKKETNLMKIRMHIHQKFTEHCGYHAEHGFPVTVNAVLKTLEDAFREYYFYQCPVNEEKVLFLRK